MLYASAAELVKYFAKKHNRRTSGIDSRYYDVTPYSYSNSLAKGGQLVCTFGRTDDRPVFDNNLTDDYMRAVIARPAGEYFEQVSIFGIITPKAQLSEHELEEYCEYINNINSDKTVFLFPENNLVNEAYKRDMLCEYVPEFALNGGMPAIVNSLYLAFKRDSVIFNVPETEEENKLHLMNFNVMCDYFDKFILEISDYLIYKACIEYDAYINHEGDSFYVGI